MGGNYFYPNMILQGKDGAWGILDINTTRPTERVYTQTFFIVVGKIAALFNIHQITMYRIAQVTGALIYFLAAYVVVKTFLPKHLHIWGLLFILGMETGPYLQAIFSSSFTSWIPSFDNQVSFLRHFGLPHHNWGKGLGLLYVAFLYKSYEHFSVTKFISLLILTFVTMLTLPPFMITFFLSVIPFFFLRAIITKTLPKFLPLLIATGSIFLVMGLFIRHEFARSIPWKYLPAGEKRWYENWDLIYRYISSLIPYSPFLYLLSITLLTAWKSLSKKIQDAIWICLPWVIMPPLYVLISKNSWFPLANMRLTDGFVYVPAGILAAIGLSGLLNALHSQRYKTGIASIVVILFLAYSGLLGYRFIRYNVELQTSSLYNLYIPVSSMEGVRFMATLPKYSGILVREQYGEIIQAFANVRVFIGGPHEFPDWLERQWLATRFFSGELSDIEARQLLNDNDISYVFYGPIEQSLTTTGTFYPALFSPVFTNDTVTVFEITKK